ncbi:MAG: DUF2807 domain-containing protein [Planctomycetes bacterium]|nr:DUF2807 domain-containing protein [Planctomycetota bacterium]
MTRVVGLVLAAAAAASCAGSVGPKGLEARAEFVDPAPQTEERAVAGFERLRVEGVVDVEVRLGSPHALRVRGDVGRLCEITAEVRDGTLILGAAPGRPWRGAPRAFVEAPRLDALVAAGAGWTAVFGLDQDELEVRVEGSGDVLLAGRVGAVRADLRGAGRLDRRQLVIR